MKEGDLPFMPSFSLAMFADSNSPKPTKMQLGARGMQHTATVCGVNMDYAEGCISPPFPVSLLVQQ